MTGGMMFKGTPGPWEIRKAGNGDRGIRAPGTGIFIEAFAEIRHSGEGAYDECKANANLIAAAPDLLEALMKILSEYDNWKGYNDDGLEEETELYARAAIAKALGEEK